MAGTIRLASVRWGAIARNGVVESKHSVRQMCDRFENIGARANAHDVAAIGWVHDGNMSHAYDQRYDGIGNDNWSHVLQARSAWIAKRPRSISVDENIAESSWCGPFNSEGVWCHRIGGGRLGWQVGSILCARIDQFATSNANWIQDARTELE